MTDLRPMKLFFGNKFLVFFLLLTTIVFGQQSYLDTFSSVSYSENDGTQNWSSNWVETNENGDPSTGRIRILGNRLRLQRLTTNRSLHRSIDLSGYASAILTLDYQTTNLAPGDRLYIQVSSNGGSTFSTLDYISGTESYSYSKDISAYISANTIVRFTNTGSQWPANNNRAFIDNLNLFSLITLSKSLSA